MTAGRRGVLQSMQSLYQPPSRRAAVTGKVCELCVLEIPDAHSHVADMENRSLLCVCRACYLLFTRPEAGKRRYRSVPERYEAVEGVSKGLWETLDVPVNMAFVFVSSAQDAPLAVYPSPGGPVESEVRLAGWDSVREQVPALSGMEPDVEAALFRASDSEVECYVVPIDRCYELVGELRMLWQGFDGGEEAHRHLDGFFAQVRTRSGGAS